MKRFIYIIAVLITLLAPTMAYSGRAIAIDIFPTCKQGAREAGTNVCNSVEAQNRAKTNPIIDILKISLNILSYITGILAIFLILINAIRFIASGGDANGIKAAKNGVLYVIIGLVVAVSAQIIVVFVLNKI